MMVEIKKVKLLAVFALTMMAMTPDAKALIPLLSADFGRLTSAAQITMNDIMIIKQEIDNNIKAIKEIQNGGFAAAGAAIFGNIQSDELDRFGNMWSDAKSQYDEIKNMSDSVQDQLKQAEEELKNRYGEEYERLKDAKEEIDRGKAAFDNAYSWYKDNKSDPGNALKDIVDNIDDDTLNNALSGDWNQFGIDADDVRNFTNDVADGGLGGAFNSATGDIGSGIKDTAIEEGRKICYQKCYDTTKKAADKNAQSNGKNEASSEEISDIEKKCNSLCSKEL